MKSTRTLVALLLCAFYHPDAFAFHINMPLTTSNLFFKSSSSSKLQRRMDDDNTHQEQHHHHHLYQEDESSRRSFLVLGGACFMTTAVISPLLLPQIAHAGLLDDFGTDMKITDNRSNNNNAAVPLPVNKPAAATTTEIDPSLRASYYYPTAKKRYLPRIQKVSQEILACNDALLQEDWESVQRFKGTAENAILPLQLYVSSLDGQGLSQSTQYAKIMRQDAMDYQKAFQRFDKALQMRDSIIAMQAVSDMGVAVADYQQQGRLKDDDGNIPSIDEMKRMTMRRPTVSI